MKWFGFVGKKKKFILPKWVEYLGYVALSTIAFVLTYAVIWIFYVIFQICHL